MVRAATLKARAAKTGTKEKAEANFPWEEDGSAESGAVATEILPCKGIVNLGNTCFFNSVLQNLVRTNDFRHCVLNGADEDSTRAPAIGPEEAGTGTGEGGHAAGDEVETGPLTDVLGAFFEDMCTASSKKKGASNVRPTELFSELIRQSPRYKGYQQHDAHELLWTLLDLLRMEERKRLKALGVAGTPQVESKSNGTSTEDANGSEAGRPRAKPPQTYIERIFGGHCRSGIKCMSCGHESVIYEPFLDLCLPILEASAHKPAVAEAVEEEPPRRDRKKQLAAARSEKQRQKKESNKGARAKDAQQADADEEEADSGEEDGTGRGKRTGKEKKKPMTKHEKKLEMARIKAEKIAAARMKRRTKQFDEFYSKSDSTEDGDHDEARASPGDDDSIAHAGEGAVSPELPLNCAGQAGRTPAVNEAEEVEADAADKTIGDVARQGVALKSNPTLVSLDGESASQHSVKEDQGEDKPEDIMSSASSDSHNAGVGGEVDWAGDGVVEEQDLDAFLAAQDAEAIRKRQAAEELVFAAPDPRRGLHNDVDYDEDDPEAFLVRQDAIALAKRTGAEAGGEGVGDEAGAGQGRDSRAHGSEDAEAEGRGADEAFVEALAEAVGGLAVQAGDGDEDASHAAEGNSPEQASAAEQRDGPPSSKRRSPRAPLGLVFKEEEECQSRGVWDAVKAGLVAPGSVSEGLREYCRVEVLDGDNMYACDQCSRQFREQGRKGMEEARQRRRSREAKGSSTEEEEAEDDEEDSKRKEEAVRAEVKSPALKQTLLWALPRFLVLNLKRFTQTEASAVYDLYGLVEHHGSLGGGHYVAYSTDPALLQGSACASEDAEMGDADGPSPRQWYYFSDTSVKAVSEDKVLAREAYILFYRRVQQ